MRRQPFDTETPNTDKIPQEGIDELAKQLTFGEDARAAMKRGIDTMANTVGVTLGPRGRNVILDKKFGPPQVSSDGVSIAKEIELEDAYENMGAQLLKEAASKTADVAGDGTTTATVLAQAIINEGFRNIAAGSDPMAIKRGIEKGVVALRNSVSDMANPVEGKEQITQVASLSAHDDDVRVGGDLVWAEGGVRTPDGDRDAASAEAAANS